MNPKPLNGPETYTLEMVEGPWLGRVWGTCSSFGLMFHDSCMLVMVLSGGGGVADGVDSAGSGSGGAVEATAPGSDAADVGDDAPYPLGFRV